MKYLLDTADIQAIKKISTFFPIDGVTTNPTIVANENPKDVKKFFLDIRKIIGENRMLHIQCIGQMADVIIEEAKVLSEIFNKNIFIKIPVTLEGLRAIKEIRALNINIGITATAILSLNQAILAAQSGADFVAPYVNRADFYCEDGEILVDKILKVFSANDIKCQVLAASFKNVKQIEQILLKGVHSITIEPSLFEHLIEHHITSMSIHKFHSDWNKVFKENSTLIDLLK